MTPLKRKFTVKVKEEDGTDKELALCVVRPNLKQQQEAQQVHNRAFAQAVESKAILRAQADTIVKDRGLWTEEQETKQQALRKSLRDNERKLKQGGIKLTEAKAIALQMRADRTAIRELDAERTTLDVNTAEGQAEQARFSYLVSICTRYDQDNKPYFSSFEDYQTRENDPVAFEAASALGTLLYALDPDYEAKRPENTFLKKFRMCDSKLRLINKDGRLTDSEGRLIDEEGRYVNLDGQYVDVNGNRVTRDGDLVVEEVSPFLDEDGHPVEEPADVAV